MTWKVAHLARSLLVPATAGVFLLSSAASSADPSGHGGQKLLLNAYSQGSTGMAGPVATPHVLKAGRTYRVTVKGTYSAYAATLMDGTTPRWHMCGTPVSAPRKPKISDLEGQDAEFIFAKPKPNGTFCPPLPFVHPNFVISTNGPSGPFVHVDPVGGVPTQVDPHHDYVYEITGTGNRASFAILDSNTTDNYGTLTIHVRP
jgi:hypothetical protein